MFSREFCAIFKNSFQFKELKRSWIEGWISSFFLTQREGEARGIPGESCQTSMLELFAEKRKAKSR